MPNGNNQNLHQRPYSLPTTIDGLFLRMDGVRGRGLKRHTIRVVALRPEG